MVQEIKEDPVIKIIEVVEVIDVVYAQIVKIDEAIEQNGFRGMVLAIYVYELDNG